MKGNWIIQTLVCHYPVYLYNVGHRIGFAIARCIFLLIGVLSILKASVQANSKHMDIGNNNYWNSKNIHLIISTLVVTGIAFAYGIAPSKTLPILFDFEVSSVDLKNIFRAIMFLYLGNVIMWVIGILRPTYWTAATIMNSVFMGGLALGRILSCIVDGIPSILFFLGMFGELTLCIYGLLQLQRHARKVQ